MRIVVLIAAAVLAATPIYAQDKDAEECGDKVSTPEIVDCLKGLTAIWDNKLNEAYQRRLGRVAARQREPLRAAQRLWIQYRDADCMYYALGEGTIARVEAAECMRHDGEPRHGA